jgi:hypothetical protein
MLLIKMKNVTSHTGEREGKILPNFIEGWERV